jgi:hypothetical protein
MFDAHQTSARTGHTTTVAFLAVAFIFSPAILVISRPLGYVSISMAIACSVVCVALAWVNWKRSSPPSRPAIAIQRAAVK